VRWDPATPGSNPPERIVRHRVDAKAPPLEAPINVEVTDGSVPPPDSSGQRAPLASEAIPTAARLQLLGKIASAIAHDFNNLLTVMLTCVDTAAAALPATSVARSELEAAQAAGRQCARLVQQVLGKRAERSEATADANAVLAESAALLGRVMGHATLRLEPGLGVWPVRASADEIWQILFNLALNARDAMPADGTLVVHTRVESYAAPQPRPRLAAGDYAVLSVSDSGCGIDTKTQERMFEPYFTTKGSGGSGIGLATVARIVHKCGGAIRVESQPGHGSVFEVFLPRART
jgi:signal transduction histidine kinase